MRFKRWVSRVSLALIISVSVGAVEAGVLFQAEGYSAASAIGRASTHVGYIGSGYVDFGGNGSWMEWNNIRVATDGRYELTLRFANGGGSPRQAAAIINGANRGNLLFNQTGGWTSWRTDTMTVDLRAGSNTVRIQANSSAGGPNLDSIDVELLDRADDTFGDTLLSGQTLVAEQRLTSSDGSHFLILQGDGNLVLRNAGTGSALWSTGTNGKGAARFILQGDGNLVLRNAAGSTVWSSGTNGRGGVRLAMQADGNLVLRNTSGTAIWSTGKDQPPADTTRPVISLNGSASIVLNQGSAFSDPGATASDDLDGDISRRIQVSGTVNTGALGTSTLRYDVRDAAGNAATTVTRTVSVTSNGGGGDNGGSDDGVRLPIEVLGPAGTRKSVSFELNDVSSISHLYLRCNACGYHDIALDRNTSKTKATVRVNGGSAIPLKHFAENGRVYGNGQIRIIGGEADYGGIGGGFRTVRLMVPVSGLRTGRNTLIFEHLDAEAPSIGFRILELNLLENGSFSRKVLLDDDFVQDDPADWSAPRSSSGDIAKGASLWKQRNRLYDPWVDSLDGRGNGQGAVTGKLQASCADCHASDGRDLKYFNFSNQSIIERSKFHGLTQTEGELVASYIRQLDIPVVDQARPWNPAYQPGLELDSQPAYEWAAGAGLDAVLDRDSDMAPYLFPRGTSLDAVRAVVDRYRTLNLRELPINIPMPEWNQWLPIIHPDDAFNTSASAIRSDANGRNMGMPYYEKIYDDATANPNPATLGGFSADIKSWLRRDLTCSTSGLNNGEPMRGLNGAVLSALRLPSPAVTSSNCTSINPGSLKNLEHAKRGLTAWASVKMWEVIHSNDLEVESRTMTRSVCSGGRCINASEARGWVADGRNLFDRPPHFTGVGGGRKYFSQNEMLGILESNAWYHLNMILNPGYRLTMPSHFAYTYSHVELLQQYSDIDQGYRFWATMIKQRQLQTSGRYGIEAGLDLRTAQPYVYYGTGRNRTNTETQSSVGQPLWGRLAQAMVEDFVEDANNATAQNWAGATQNRKVQDRNSTNFSACSGVCTFDLGAYQGRNTYRVILELRKIGVGESVIQDLIDWGQITWPRGPWSRVR
ncbi:immunoglobulin-like domain-containing protein [Allohahella sp. A8]|uniref:immunoglobulin-like domain-containing protein n=1 Tax=Allohahella sp. A8 TaxID=3141461 RepID=UPI003A80FC0F